MQNHEKIWHHCGDGLILVSAKTGCLVDANARAGKLLGRPLGALRSLPFTALYQPDERDRAAEALNDWSAGSEAICNLNVLRPDETRVPVSVSAGVFEDEGQLIIVCGLRDDSTRRKAEDAVVRLNWALSAIRRANLAAASTDTETDLTRSVCEGILGDVFVLAWIGLANDDPAKTVTAVAASGRTAYLDNLSISWADVPSGKGPTGLAIRLCETRINNFALTNPAFAPWAERARAHGIGSSVSAPLVRDGVAFGALTIYSDRVDAFGPDEVRVFEDLARDVVFGLDARRASAALKEREQSWRSLFDHMLGGFAHCRMHYEGDVPVDFTYLDVNPAFHRLTGLGDVVGRRVSEVIPGVRESSPELFEVYGRVARTGVPERFFDRRMNADAEERLALRNGLRLALERNEFVLHYQPQIDLADGHVIGTEALLRWRHPELGLIPPGKFIPIAEESGLIVPIGAWVLHEACRQAVAWQRADLPTLVVAVNLSAVQFRRGRLEETVIAALTSSGLDPGLLELELTESILIGDTETVLQTIRRLKMFGIALSIDDFGTGYSSLAYLKRFAVDKLKIDQSFVRGLVTDPGDEAIVRAIIGMARSLGLRTIAEGVEDEQVLDLLRDCHCDEAQGYHIARPMPVEDFTAYMRANR